MTCIGFDRWSHNTTLYTWDREYKAGNKPTERKVRDIVKSELPDWAKDKPKSIIDTACEHVGKAYVNFFEKRAGHPVYRKKHDDKQRFELYRKSDSSIRIRGRKWYFLKEEIKLSEPLRFSGEIKRLTCKKEYGKYYISVIFDDKPIKTVNSEKEIGLDWGIYDGNRNGHFFTGSDGSTYDLPDLSIYESKIKYLQKRVSKAKKGSNRYLKAKAKLNRYEERLNNIKTDAQNKLVHKLTTEYKTIAIESLEIKKMVKKAKNKKAKRKALLKYSNYKIFVALERKAMEFRKVPKYTATSQICSKCGKIHPEMKNDDIRIFECDCGLCIDRDLNAAKNILKLSVASQNN